MKTLFIPMKQKVNRYTRAGYNGKSITCPLCEHEETIYHFAWSALGCTNCKEMINKQDWYLTEVN